MLLFLVSEEVKSKHPRISYADLYQVIIVLQELLFLYFSSSTCKLRDFTKIIRVFSLQFVGHSMDSLMKILIKGHDYLYFQLAGVVAVELTGGPTIDFSPGRKVCCGQWSVISRNRASLPIIVFQVFICFLVFYRIQKSLLRKDGFQMLNEVYSNT